MMLPTDAQERKNIPVYSGFICYFPDAIAEVAKLSKEGNDQHNPGSPLHWDRGKSGDERDALMRHVLDGALIFAPNLEQAILEARAVAWRAMADLQKLCEKRAGEYATGDDAQGYTIYRQGEFVGHLNGAFNNDPDEALAYFLSMPDPENSESKKIAPGSWISPTPEERAAYTRSLQDIEGSRK